MTASVEILGVTKRYRGAAVVRDLSLTIAAGEFFTLLGSSGSGKTTTLMMVAGFAEPDGGDIRIGGRSVKALPPERRNLGVVFQSYALFPTMTVAQNIGFPLRMRRLDRAAARRKVEEALRLVDLQGYGDRRITQLSGGQQQRVALARALVFEPPILLMDEPLGALDRKLREQLQGEIKRIQQSLGLTVLYVTHDQEEALVLSDRIAVMAEGEIRQLGPPAELYARPASRFVAQFLGESNFLEGRVAGSEGEEIRLELPRGQGIVTARGRPVAGRERIELMLRPEAFALARDRAGDGNRLAGRVESVQFLGPSIRYGVATELGLFWVRRPRAASALLYAAGEAVFLTWQPEDAEILP